MDANAYGIADLLRRAARYYPQKTFLVVGDRRVTYEELDQRSNRLSQALLALGIRKGDHVSILFQNSPQFMECFFAAAKLGAANVLLSTRLAPRELAYEIDQSDSSVLLCDARFAETIDAIRPELPRLKSVVIDDRVSRNGALSYEELLAAFPPEDPGAEVHLQDPCIMYYTSGTTGLPKAAVRTHLNALSTAQWAAVKSTTDLGYDIWLGFAPWFHMAGWECNALPAMLTSSTLISASSFDPAKVLEAIEREKVTVLFLVPTMAARIVNLPELDRFDRSSVRNLVCGSAPIPELLKMKIMDCFPNADYHEGYGSTEGGQIAVLNRDDAVRKSLCAGSAVYSAKIRVVDDFENDVPIGEIGEIVVQGPQVMSGGYYKDPEKTAEAFRGGWFHTGDLGRMDAEQRLYVVDRKKDMIKTGSENVYSAEVESVILEHPAVLEAAVIGLPDEEWGERVAAVVVLKEDATLSEGELIEYCRSKMAHYRCPKQVFLLGEPLPVVSTGKINKRELRTRFGGSPPPLPRKAEAVRGMSCGEPRELVAAISTRAAEAAQRASWLAHEYLRMYGSCGQCVIAAVQQTMGGEVDEAAFKAAHALAGGAASSGEGTCGALSGGMMAISSVVGREWPSFARGGSVAAMVPAKRLYDHFVEEYGSCVCRGVLTRVLGRPYNLWDADDARAYLEAGGRSDKCADVSGKVAEWTVEILKESETAT